MSAASAWELFSTGNIWLLSTVLILMTIEVFTSAAMAWRAKKPLKEREWRDTLLIKLMILSLVIVSAAFDMALKFMSPTGFMDEVHILQYNLITKGTLIWLIVAEGSTIVANVSSTGKSGYVPATIRWFIQQIRRVDEKRFPSDGAPMRRWWDDLTDEQIAEVLEKRAMGKHSPERDA